MIKKHDLKLMHVNVEILIKHVTPTEENYETKL